MQVVTEKEKRKMTTVTINKELNGIEITFNAKPERVVLDSLKGAGFRWHNAKKLWYAKNTEERLLLAQNIGDINEYVAQIKREEPKSETPKKNKYGVQVGDIFSASWGYEQTNVDFFQVVELVGTSSVRVRGVSLPLVEEIAISGMSSDRVYKNTKELLPARRNVFIEDDEHGDLKRLKSYAADGVSNPTFKLSSFADAHYCSGDTIKTYESWYY